ncbi:MAG: hypothetical protein HXX13_10860 [Bacteroidetes bacterium]|nr:hypothetical protein [Bacteroidota bacterium]
MNYYLKILAISFISIQLLSSCEKKTDMVTESDPGVAFCAGSYTNENGYQVPCYWSGTSRVELKGEGLITGVVNAIYVVNGIVYCAGTYSSAKKSGIPCYWEGSLLHVLDAAGYAVPSCITHAGGITYTGGEYLDETNKVQSCYWKGSAIHKLSDQGYNSKVICIGVTSSGNVFCAGSNSSTYTGSPYYYKNDEYHHLSVNDILNPFSHAYDYHSGEVKGLDIVGEEVFFGGSGEGVYSAWAGGTQPQPGKWKEDDVAFTALSIDYDGSCQSVCAANGTVYYGGNLDPDGPNNNNKELTACYWQEGTDVTFLPDGQLVQAIGYYKSTLFCVVTGISGKSNPVYWDGAQWYELVGSTDIGKAQLRCYAIAR